MGRIWDFLNQDANTAMDRINKPYLDFLLAHRVFMYIIFAGGIACVWVFISRTVALLFVALWVVLTLYGVAVLLWRRRG